MNIEQAMNHLRGKEWWPDETKRIYLDAVDDLCGDSAALKYGPGHIVWADDNFSDDNIRFCLTECETRRQFWLDEFGEYALDIAREALERLLAVPESVRDCDDPYCD